MQRCVARGFLIALTHWGRDKIDAISQTTISNTFSWMKMLECRLKFHWSVFLRVGPINNILSLVQIMAWRRPGDKPLSEPMMVRFPTHICVIRLQWVSTLRPRHNGHHYLDDIFKCILFYENVWIFIFKSNWQYVSIVQIMAWCRTGDKPIAEPIMVYFSDA